MWKYGFRPWTLDHGAVKLLTRTGLDWTRKYPAIARAMAALDARQAYLDGELCGVGLVVTDVPKVPINQYVAPQGWI